jgi:hypothetical protein
LRELDEDLRDVGQEGHQGAETQFDGGDALASLRSRPGYSTSLITL